MNKNTNDFEIMAPVGSRESLAAAINAGANSVYFGIGKLNMRSHSANHFTIDDLKEIAETCNEKGIQTYLTVNTVIYGEDIETMHEIIDAAKAANITAVIASDVAVMMYCRQVGVEVHLSTQLNISNIDALKFYAQFADVAVLARELNMDQVKEIHEQIIKQNICGPKGQPIRIEMFCHGAFCMAISGKCYMSLHDSNRSANRGACTQICRRSYTVTDNETGNQLEIDNKYIMSPKDLKSVRFIDKMMDAGVRVCLRLRVVRVDQSMFTPLLAATKRLSRAYSMVPSPKKRRTSGTNDSQQSSTVASGMATIKVRRWANGQRIMAIRLQRRRCSSVR